METRPKDTTRPPLDDPPSDRSLLRRFRDGSQDAAGLLYERYAHRLHALARAKQSRDLLGRLDDDDVVQSVFKSFFRGVMRGSYDVPAGEELWNLFLVITLNKIRANGVHHRAAKRDVRQTVGDYEIDSSGEALDSDHQSYVLLKLSVQEVFETLPPQHQQVIQLRMEGYEVAEIAARTGRAKRSIERVLRECLERLGRSLGMGSESE